MNKGIIKWYNQKKGFGFIEQDGPDPDCFVHYSEIKDKSITLKEGDRVSYDVVAGTKGPIANKVKRTN